MTCFSQESRRTLAPGLLIAASLLCSTSAWAGDQVDLTFETSACVNIGDTLEVELYATSNGASTLAVGAIDVVLNWDPAVFELLGHDSSTAGYAWFIADFLPDPDGINTSLLDGDALFTALPSPALAAQVSPAGLLVTKLQFKALVAASSTNLSMVPSLGAFGLTRVLDFNMTGVDITGDISDIEALTSCGGGGLGTNYCPGVPNSTGFPSIMSATGSDVVADNDLFLKCEQIPAGKFGYFIFSRTSGFIANPGGSVGNLCIGSPFGRFNAFIAQASAGGVLDLQVPDMLNMPLLGAIVPGETWYFQLWHRDVSGTSNFSDGLEIPFF